MSINQFIEIDAPGMCVLEGENDELCNDGVYGKSLALYLQARLPAYGYCVPWFVCEDWGWYVAVEKSDFQMAVCVYGFPRWENQIAVTTDPDDGEPDRDENAVPAGTPLSLCVTVGTKPRKYWLWRRLRFVDRTEVIVKLNDDLQTVFEDDPEIAIVGCTPEFPLG